MHTILPHACIFLLAHHPPIAHQTHLVGALCVVQAMGSPPSSVPLSAVVKVEVPQGTHAGAPTQDWQGTPVLASLFSLLSLTSPGFDPHRRKRQCL